MKSRPRPTEAPPERLVRFVAVEWPAATVEDAFEMWRQARLAVAQRNPSGPLGDVVDVLRGHGEALRRLGGQP